MPLTAKQMEYLAIAWQCFDVEPKIDYEKFKNVAGLASAASARELMRVTKNKLKSEYGALGASIAASNVKPSPTKRTTSEAAATPKSSGAKRSRSVRVSDGDNEDVNADHTPAKKAKTFPAKDGRIKTEPVAELAKEEDEHTLI